MLVPGIISEETLKRFSTAANARKPSQVSLPRHAAAFRVSFGPLIRKT